MGTRSLLICIAMKVNKVEPFVVVFFITWTVILLYALNMMRTYHNLQRERNILKEVGRNCITYE
jgi:CcmD family protein